MQNTVIERKTGGGQTQSKNSRRIIREFARVMASPVERHVTQLFVQQSRKFGFTLAEVLITLLIVGIMAAVILPVVQKAHPDKLEAMRRKSYYILENTVAQMLSDDSMYRPRSDGSATGFRNTEKVKISGVIYEGKTKFCELYANTLTKRPNSRTDCSVGQKTFTTSDNVDWYLPVSDFSGGYAEVKFDVNGKAEPNCEYDFEACPKPDTFTYYVLASGKIVESNPKFSNIKHCIKTNVTGNGTVTPSSNYCDLPNGTYTIKVMPASGWQSNWPVNEKTIKIKDKDVNLSVVFTESPKACIKLNVNCESGTPDKCANYNFSNTVPNANGNELSLCNLSSGNYTINISPKQNYIASWTSQDVNLYGVDQNLSVSIYEKKYCATLNVSCPGGGANICANYVLTGNGNTYEMDSLGNAARSCTLKKGTYTLHVTPTKYYETDSSDFNFAIVDKDWSNDIQFTKLKESCNDRGYLKLNNGKCLTSPFRPQPVSKAECERLKVNDSGINNCWFENDYWAGAVKQCGGTQNMPSLQDMLEISSLIYSNYPNTGNKMEEVNGLNYNSDIPSSFMRSFNLWSTDTYYADAVYIRYYYSGGTYTDRYNKSAEYIYAACFVD